MGVLEGEVMRYYKRIDGDYITMIGMGDGGVEITETEYDSILSVIRNKPEETAVIGYRLKTDLTWEQYEKEPEEEPEPTSDDILNILLGGDSE
jgi:hypothetical protein